MTQQREKLAESTALRVVLGNEVYALPIAALLAVYVGVPLIAVPCAPAFVAGIANIRGRILPVFDLARLLEVPVDETNDQYALVAATNGQTTLALRVGATGEVVTVLQRDIVAIPDIHLLAHHHYVRGICPDGAILCDIQALLNDDSLVVNETVGE